MKKTYNIPLPCHELTKKIIESFYKTLTEFDNSKGVPEAAFSKQLAINLRQKGMDVALNKMIPMIKNGIILTCMRPSMVVEGLIVIEIKNVQHITRKHKAQGTLYLDYGGYPAGLFLNYGVDKSHIERIPLPGKYHREVKQCPGS